MTDDANQPPDRDDWLREGYRAYMRSLTPAQKEQLLRHAWVEGYKVGGEEKAKRRMEEKYRELNPVEPEGAS